MSKPVLESSFLPLLFANSQVRTQSEPSFVPGPCRSARSHHRFASRRYSTGRINEALAAVSQFPFLLCPYFPRTVSSVFLCVIYRWCSRGSGADCLHPLCDQSVFPWCLVPSTGWYRGLYWCHNPQIRGIPYVTAVPCRCTGYFPYPE